MKLKTLLEPFGITHFYTDNWGAYERHLPYEQQVVGKANTQKIERKLSGAPYGDHYLSRWEGGGEARDEIIPEQAQVVQQIFTWIGEERLSLGTLTRRLRERGIPRPSAQGRWDRTSVWGILKNPADCGRAAFGKTRARAGAPNGASTPSHGAIGPTVGARVPDPTDEGGLVFCDEDSAMEAPPDERSGNR